MGFEGVAPSLPHGYTLEEAIDVTDASNPISLSSHQSASGGYEYSVKRNNKVKLTAKASRSA